jgi:arsenite methyltransferase
VGAFRWRPGRCRTIQAAGFEIDTWHENTQYRSISDRADNATQKYGVTSISLLARRPEQ